jgi:hypothetical protein
VVRSGSHESRALALYFSDDNTLSRLVGVGKIAFTRSVSSAANSGPAARPSTVRIAAYSAPYSFCWRRAMILLRLLLIQGWWYAMANSSTAGVLLVYEALQVTDQVRPAQLPPIVS